MEAFLVSAALILVKGGAAAQSLFQKGLARLLINLELMRPRMPIAYGA
jgi:hypothetical protein